MNIVIQKPFSINEIGARVNNEDATYPKNEEVSTNDKLFLVCDGVGGSNKGEIASAIACEAIQTYFNTFIDPQNEINPEFIEKAIRYAEIRFDDHIRENPDSKGMATTLCLLYFSPNGVFLTHAGDSRIYQVRGNEIIFKTEDHSLVNSLIKTGQVRTEDAQKHPQKNVILRALQGSDHPVDVDVIQITDLQPGDQFLMCTDGVFEAVDDDLICNILGAGGNPESKLTKIKESCSGKSKDNYSAYLIPIQDIQDSKTFKQIFASFLYAFI